MSKSNKGCQYVFKQGAKKGKACKVACRGKFCFNHKTKRVTQKAAYYRATQVNKVLTEHETEINDIKNCKTVKDLPNFNRITGMRCHLYANGQKCKKKIFGLRKVLGYNDSAAIEKFDKQLNARRAAMADRVFFHRQDPVIPFTGTESEAKKKCAKLMIKLHDIVTKINWHDELLAAIKAAEERITGKKENVIPNTDLPNYDSDVKTDESTDSESESD